MRIIDPVEVVLIESHKAINDSMEQAFEALSSFNLAYPPGAQLTAEEMNALKSFHLSPAERSGLQKIFTDASAGAFFRFLSILDGVGDPEVSDLKVWLGLSLGKKRENEDMLHDKFFETFHKYKQWSDEKRINGIPNEG